MKKAELVEGRVVHDVPLAPPESRCHAGAGHDDNVCDRGAAGDLCVACFASLMRILGAR